MEEKTPKGKGWIVRIKKTMSCEVITTDCSQEQAENTPYEFLAEEIDMGLLDYEVLSVRKNS